MSYEQSLATLEKLLFGGVSLNDDADTIKMLLLRPKVIMQNPHYYLELALGAAARLYKDGDYEAAVEILIGMFNLDGIEEDEGESEVSLTYYCQTIILMEVLTALSLLKIGAASLAFDYIEAVVQNIDTYLSEEKQYVTMRDALLNLGFSLVN